jgi:hypothetical protein
MDSANEVAAAVTTCRVGAVAESVVEPFTVVALAVLRTFSFLPFPFYSCLSASSGSTRDARRAGR